MLPTPATAARSLGYGYHMADIDLGEMFLNFPLHSTLQRFSVVDLTHYNLNLTKPLSGPERAKWVHWTRCWMGLGPLDKVLDGLKAKPIVWQLDFTIGPMSSGEETDVT